MLRLPSYLQRHPQSGIYYFRIAIPKPLAAQLKQREWKKSLRTRDPQAAKRTARLLSLQAEYLFDQLLRTPMPKKSEPTLSLVIDAFTKHPDGRVEMQGVELNPDKAAPIRGPESPRGESPRSYDDTSPTCTFSNSSSTSRTYRYTAGMSRNCPPGTEALRANDSTPDAMTETSRSHACRVASARRTVSRWSAISASDTPCCQVIS